MKVPILRILCALVKITQIPHVIFQSTSQFFFKFCITLQCHEIQPPCTFLAQTLYTLVKSSSLKCNFLRLLSSRVKICQIPYVNFEMTSQSSSDFLSFLSVITYNSFVSLQLMQFILWTKRSHENTNFDSFKCSNENLPTSSCHFQTTSQFSFKLCTTYQCHEI